MRSKAIAATLLGQPRNGQCKFHLGSGSGRISVSCRAHGRLANSGTGVPPVCSRPETHGRDSRATMRPPRKPPLCPQTPILHTAELLGVRDAARTVRLEACPTCLRRFIAPTHI